ncbi:hypothetical protein M407DRAFT_246801 [Tulasnella calospora MUT 4182]|uniref:Uncharacterized protein n=1 Tax=Tulasnella calospora MUT 4182 TaxID=1051891 RepID=A0A0C3PRH9_9AGAM|nr:hypothetical protein M407DRAFT_246801 [Tulasnella calospora MUT 4182]
MHYEQFMNGVWDVPKKVWYLSWLCNCPFLIGNPIIWRLDSRFHWHCNWEIQNWMVTLPRPHRFSSYAQARI